MAQRLNGVTSGANCPQGDAELNHLNKSCSSGSCKAVRTSDFRNIQRKYRTEGRHKVGAVGIKGQKLLREGTAISLLEVTTAYENCSRILQLVQSLQLMLSSRVRGALPPRHATPRRTSWHGA
jgi:hypothetical protein